MKKKDKGRLTGGVTPQGDLEGNTHDDPKTELEERAKKQYKTLEKILHDLSSVQLSSIRSIPLIWWRRSMSAACSICSVNRASFSVQTSGTEQ